MQDLFSLPHITEEDVLAFVGSNITAYSVEHKHGKIPFALRYHIHGTT